VPRLVSTFFLFQCLGAALVCADASGEIRTLEAGDILRFQVVEDRGETLVVEHPELGRVTIHRRPAAEARGGDRDDADEAAGALVAESVVPTIREEAPAEEDGGLFGTRFMRGWSSRLSAGLTGSSGGFDDTKLNFRFRTGIESEKRQWEFDVSYLLNVAPQTEDTSDADASERKITKNQGTGLGRRTWFYPDSERWKKWSTFAQTRYQYDEFQPWEHRISATVGPGYELVATERWNLSPRLGVGGAWTAGRNDDLYAEAMLAVDLSWKPNDFNKLSAKNEFFLSMDSANRFRTVQSVEWEIELNDSFGLDIGLLYKYDTDSEGRENDLTYFGALSYLF